MLKNHTLKKGVYKSANWHICLLKTIVVQSVNNLIVYKEGIQFYNGENKRDERSRYTCVHTFKSCEKSRYILVDMEVFLL